MDPANHPPGSTEQMFIRYYVYFALYFISFVFYLFKILSLKYLVFHIFLDPHPHKLTNALAFAACSMSHVFHEANSLLPILNQTAASIRSAPEQLVPLYVLPDKNEDSSLRSNGGDRINSRRECTAHFFAPE